MERKVIAETGVLGLEEREHLVKHGRRVEDKLSGVTVGQVLDLTSSICKLRPWDALGDVAEALVFSGRTAMAVTNEDGGGLAGLITVNDVMRAYFEGTPSDTPISEWLGSGRARAPAKRLRRLSVSPAAPVSQVAERMVANAVSGDCACHHVVVQEDGGPLHGVLSSHDIVAALCDHELWDSSPGHANPFMPPGTEEASAPMTVRDAMKHSGRVFTCPPTDTMRDAIKVLLVTQQNSILVIDDEGVYGFVTTCDAVKCFADGVHSTTQIADWLSLRPQEVQKRTVDIDLPLSDAAAKMTDEHVDHLVVVQADRPEAVGVLSSLDVLMRTKPHAPLLRTMPLWKGPTMGDVLKEQAHLTEIYEKGFTLGEAAALLARSGRTSVIVETPRGSSSHALLTENEMLRAYLDGWEPSAAAEDLLRTTEAEHAEMLQSYQVPPSVCLTEAASLMLSAAEPGHTCHHLVVRAVDGQWLGVFSALDIARTLHGLPSELEVAKTGADQTTVDMIMKPISTVPECSRRDTMYIALNCLDVYCQNAAVVVDEKGFHGLITARCALQAFATGYSREEKIGTWLHSHRGQDGPRHVLLGTKLLEAAAIMSERSLHHLLVMEAPGGNPVGILSALDVARAVVSINYHCPFVSLAWLRLFGGPAGVPVEKERPRASQKRALSPSAAESAEELPPSSARRAVSGA